MKFEMPAKVGLEKSILVAAVYEAKHWQKFEMGIFLWKDARSKDNSKLMM